MDNQELGKELQETLFQAELTMLVKSLKEDFALFSQNVMHISVAGV